MATYDPRLEYITAELRRARNKRYESYVINRIWGLVCDLPLRPRTQMYARVEDGTRRFVDLCFPEVGIAVEVDEAQHAGSTEADREREAQITASDILDGLYDGDLEFLRVQVYDRSFADIEARIESVAKRVREKARSLPPEGVWLFLDPEAWCVQHDRIDARDPVRFDTMAQACNCVVGTDYTRLQRAYFTPKVFRGTGRENTKMWFPHLAVGDQAATKTGWVNYIDSETGTITEVQPSGMERNYTPLEDEPERIVFVQSRDQLTGRGSYRFAGIYRPTGRGERSTTYTRMSSEMPIASKDD